MYRKVVMVHVIDGEEKKMFVSIDDDRDVEMVKSMKLTAIESGFKIISDDEVDINTYCNGTAKFLSDSLGDFHDTFTPDMSSYNSFMMDLMHYKALYGAIKELTRFAKTHDVGDFTMPENLTHFVEFVEAGAERAQQ